MKLNRWLLLLIIAISIAQLMGCATQSANTSNYAVVQKLTSTIVYWEDSSTIKIVYLNNGGLYSVTTNAARDVAIKYTVEQTKPIVKTLKDSLPFAIQDLLEKNAVVRGNESRIVAKPVAFYSTTGIPTIEIELALYRQGTSVPTWKKAIFAGASIFDTPSSAAEKLKQASLDAISKAGFFNTPN